MMQDLLDKAPCGYFSFLDDGRLLAVNETVCTLLGYTREELEDKNVSLLFPVPTRIFYQTHFFPLVKMQGYAAEIFIFLQKKDKQELPVLLNASRTESNGTASTACAFIVVHNRKKFEDELVAARKAAEKALQENSALQQAKTDLQQRAEQLDRQIHVVNQQNYELKQLNRVVTHDLREPLRKILFYTKRLQTSSSENNIQDGFIGKLTQSSEQMRAIVSGLQQYIWLNDTPVHFSSTNLHSLVKNAEEELKKEMDPGSWEISTGTLPEAEIDAEQVQLMLYHILHNAVKFKKGDKACINITASVIQRNLFKAIEHKYKYEDYLKLEISDEGIGFDPVFNEEVFELFKRLHYTEGRGLGLALCRKIAENHYGAITATSRADEGTTITVFLPLQQHGNQ